MDIEILGGILKEVGNFSMKSFEKRLIFQKTIYFLQEFDFNLGYHFNWYVAGPYSSELAGDGFKLDAIYNKTPRIILKKDENIERFNSFLNFLGKIKNDHRKMELLASLHFLSKNGFSEEVIKRRMKNKREFFRDEEILWGLEYLRRSGLYAKS